MHRHQRIGSWSYTADAKNIDSRRYSYAGGFGDGKEHLGQGGMVVTERWTPADLSFAHGLHDDPAFSADPHSNPFFASSHDTWSPPIVTASQAANHPSAHDSDDSHFVQLNNSSMWADDSTTSHESSSTDWHHSSTSASSHSTAPTSNETHLLPPYLPHARGNEQLLEKGAPWPLTEKKKMKASMSLFWRRGQTEVDVVDPASLDEDSPLDYKQGPPPPSLDAFRKERPAAPRIYTEPGLVKTVERPSIPNRAATVAADAKPPPTAARRVVGGITLSSRELDRIDELDESNPFGASIHHNGPYEAAFKSGQTGIQPQSQEERKVPHNIGDQYKFSDPMVIPDLNRPLKKEKQRSSSRPRPPPDAPVPYVPAGVSLNLAPGQILRYDFQYAQGYSGSQPEQSVTPRPHPPSERRIINGLSERDDERRRTRSASTPVDHPQYYEDEYAYSEQNSSRRLVHPDESSSRRDRRISAPQVAPSQLPSYQASISQSGSQPWQPADPKQNPAFSNGSVNSPPVERPPNHRPHNHSRLPPRMQALQRDKREKARQQQQQQQAAEESRQMLQQQQRRQLEFDAQSRNGYVDEMTLASLHSLQIDGDARANMQNHVMNTSGAIVMGSGDAFQAPSVTTSRMLALDQQYHHVTSPQRHPQDQWSSSASTISRSRTPQIQKVHELSSSRSSTDLHANFVDPEELAANQLYLQQQQQQEVMAMHTGSSIRPGSSLSRHTPSIPSDTRSLHPSLAGSGSSVGSSNSHANQRPQPLHVPKRLVMPEPLQRGEQPIAAPPRHQSQSSRSGPTYVHHWPPRLPQATGAQPTQDHDAPEYRLPPQLRPEIPMNQQRSGKLRKRSSVQVTPIYDGESHFPKVHTSLEAPLAYDTQVIEPPPSASHKMERMPKKVLSKKRADY